MKLVGIDVWKETNSENQELSTKRNKTHIQNRLPMQKWAFYIVIATLLFIGGGSATGAEISGIEQLIGLRIPPKILGSKQGDLPGWNTLGGSILSSNGNTILIERGYIKDEGGFVLIQVDRDMTRTVIDGRRLPINLLRYQLQNGKLAWRKNAINRYGIERCEKKGDVGVYVGLMKPEHGKEGCLHYSRQVKMAWRLNEKTTKLDDVSPVGVYCFYPDAEDECSK
ncbi:hypothetical protein [Sulfuritortus calidifontis]|nr:hypothetical protein [Sulfuritortus calidifontis]